MPHLASGEAHADKEIQRRKRGRSSQPRLERALSTRVLKASRSLARNEYEHHSYHERFMIPHYGFGLQGAGHRELLVKRLAGFMKYT
jgi:hypothetical protein